MAAIIEETEKRVTVPYQLLMDKIDKVADGQKQLEVSFAKLEASVTPKHEIVQEVEKRVPLAMYLADKDSLSMRLAKLEAAPQSARSWMNTYIALAGCFISAIGIALSLVVSTIVLLHTLIH